ncbi:MAG: DNA polymerase III subunit epsilon [Magnetococcales bacterium]|nr:DNA polymerase III subunit epsilon [Magnetococcales bacterium]
MARLIILDTETTGFDPNEGHRIVEIGCVELIDMRQGESRQWYINPEREIPQEAIEIHGITNEKVQDSPLFANIAREFLEFLGEGQLAAHNASFDLRFLNAELERCGRPAIAPERAIDTVTLARRKFPGSPASLDALCKRFGIDNSQRTYHGALLDAHLLAEVYVELAGGAQFRLSFETAAPTTAGSAARRAQPPIPRPTRPRRSWPIPPDEEKLHAAYLEKLQKESGDCVWLRLEPPAVS